MGLTKFMTHRSKGGQMFKTIKCVSFAVKEFSFENDCVKPIEWEGVHFSKPLNLSNSFQQILKRLFF